jgi:hypothetical protein
MNDVLLNVAFPLVAIISFLLGLRFGYRRYKSKIIPNQVIEEPVFRVIYIDPKIVRQMYGIR